LPPAVLVFFVQSGPLTHFSSVFECEHRDVRFLVWVGVPRWLDRLSHALKDIAHIEINEAFAPQVIACARDLQLDYAK
jgi:hypothetical protein